MYKKILVLLLVFVFACDVSFVSAQEEEKKEESATSSAQANSVSINDASYKQSFLDYNLALENYNKSHEEYLLRRSQYIKFKTLTAQQDAYTATLDMLTKRDEVIIAYLNTLRERVLIAEGVSYETKNRLDISLNLDKDWYIEHKQTLPSAETLDNLVSDSSKASTQYTKTKSLVYEVLYTISDGRIEDFRGRLNEIISNLIGVKDTIKGDERPEYQFSSRKIATIERFLLESENRMLRSSEQQSSAKEKLSELQKTPDGVGIYNTMVITLSSSQQFFKEVSSFLKEIVREIKTAE